MVLGVTGTPHAKHRLGKQRIRRRRTGAGNIRKANYYSGLRKIFSIFLPFASSATSLSIQRIFCISGSSMSSTRMPQTTPLIKETFGFIFGALSKNVRRSLRSCNCFFRTGFTISGQPTNNLVKLFLRAAFRFRLFYIVRIDARKDQCKNSFVLH